LEEKQFIIKLFKNSNLRVAFKVKNSIGKFPAARNIRHKDTYKETGIYQLAQIARKRYVGKTGRSILYTAK
jgi:hypothetical protein